MHLKKLVQALGNRIISNIIRLELIIFCYFWQKSNSHKILAQLSIFILLLDGAGSKLSEREGSAISTMAWDVRHDLWIWIDLNCTLANVSQQCFPAFLCIIR